MHEEVDLKEIRHDIKRKFDTESEIIHSGFINGLGFNGFKIDWHEDEENMKILYEITDYIQEKYDCFCEYEIHANGYELVFNIY